jgi:hypothetical protein
MSESLGRGVYRDLLQHSVSAVVGLVCRLLKAIQKDGGLDAAAFVDAVPAVLSQKTKSHSVVGNGDAEDAGQGAPRNWRRLQVHLSSGR